MPLPPELILTIPPTLSCPRLSFHQQEIRLPFPEKHSVHPSILKFSQYFNYKKAHTKLAQSPPKRILKASPKQSSSSIKPFAPSSFISWQRQKTNMLNPSRHYLQNHETPSEVNTYACATVSAGHLGLLP